MGLLHASNPVISHFPPPKQLVSWVLRCLLRAWKLSQLLGREATFFSFHSLPEVLPEVDGRVDSCWQRAGSCLPAQECRLLTTAGQGQG